MVVTMDSGVERIGFVVTIWWLGVMEHSGVVYYCCGERGFVDVGCGEVFGWVVCCQK